MPATIQIILRIKVPRFGFALDFHSGFFACISAMLARKYAALGSYPMPCLPGPMPALARWRSALVDV